MSLSLFLAITGAVLLTGLWLTHDGFAFWVGYCQGYARAYVRGLPGRLKGRLKGWLATRWFVLECRAAGLMWRVAHSWLDRLVRVHAARYPE